MSDNNRKMSPENIRTAGDTKSKDLADLSQAERMLAAEELVKSVGDLRLKADRNGFKFVAYLLDLAALEALDCKRSLAKAKQRNNSKRA